MNQKKVGNILSVPPNEAAEKDNIFASPDERPAAKHDDDGAVMPRNDAADEGESDGKGPPSHPSLQQQQQQQDWRQQGLYQQPQHHFLQQPQLQGLTPPSGQYYGAGQYAGGGQTPLTGGSFGGHLPTPPTGQGYPPSSILQSNYPSSSLYGAGPTMSVAEGGMLQPTPVVTRRQGGGLSAHEQQWMANLQGLPSGQRPHRQSASVPASAGSASQLKSKLAPVHEEDPSMVRYEASLAQSPMVAGEKGGGKTEGGSASSQPQEGSQTADASHQAAATAGPLLSEFPFFFDGYAAWVCRHCQHIPPYYRGGNYVWQQPHPPPNQFVDLHLRFCPGLNPENMPPSTAGMVEQMLQREGGMASQGGGYPVQQYGMPPQAMQQDKREGAPDPPGMTSPQRPSAQSEQAKASGGMPWQYPSQAQPPYPYPYPGQMPPGNVHFHPHQMPGQPPMAPASPPSKGKGKKRKLGKKGLSPKGHTTDDATYRASIAFLDRASVESARTIEEGSDVGRSLVDRTDADLLTDYFYHMMRQLVVCRFSEKDRKTRGGKRENIAVGYGGLQCIHCVDAPSARKFFWSTVDRLANSFAEIPAHVLKCKHCPDDVRDALLALKGRHSDQMQGLPRGSQKVFFRRMWRRLHDGELPGTPPGHGTPEKTGEGKEDPPPSEVKPSRSPSCGFQSPARSAPSAATLLAKSDEAASEETTSPGGTPIPAKEGSEETQRVLLAIPEDKDWLSDTDCLVRDSVEVFSARQSDVEQAAADRKYPIKVGQVGIRCVHCAASATGARGAAVAYPYSIGGIYESVREFQRLHLDSCKNVPDAAKDASARRGGGASSLSSVLRRYYVQAARALGLYDATEGGIRAGGTPVPLSTAGFQAPSGPVRSATPPQEDAPGVVADRDRDPPETARKRKASPVVEEEEQQEAKRRRPKRERSPVKSEEDAPSRDAPGEKADS